MWRLWAFIVTGLSLAAPNSANANVPADACLPLNVVAFDELFEKLVTLIECAANREAELTAEFTRLEDQVGHLDLQSSIRPVEPASMLPTISDQDSDSPGWFEMAGHWLPDGEFGWNDAVGGLESAQLTPRPYIIRGHATDGFHPLDDCFVEDVGGAYTLEYWIRPAARLLSRRAEQSYSNVNSWIESPWLPDGQLVPLQDQIPQNLDLPRPHQVRGFYRMPYGASAEDHFVQKAHGPDVNQFWIAPAGGNSTRFEGGFLLGIKLEP